MRISQIQGVQGRSRSNLLRALGIRLCTQAPEIGISSAFPKGKQDGDKKRVIITHHYSGNDLDITYCKKRVICFYKVLLDFVYAQLGYEPIVDGEF